MRRHLPAVLSGAAAALLVLLFAPIRTLSQEIQSVFVSNFPQVQPVSGDVRLSEPMPFAKQVRFNDLLVAPVPRRETTRLIEAGTLETQGFTHVVLSLRGQIGGSVVKAGDIGVVLIPDEPQIIEALDEQALIQFPLEAVAVGIDLRTPVFASNQPRFVIAFERYKVLLYNSTDKTARVDVFAYMTN